MAAKTYSLKAIETQLLRTTMQQMHTLLSNEMAMIAIERLAYNVTADTKFEFNDDLTEVTISENVPPEDTGVVTEAPKKGSK